MNGIIHLLIARGWVDHDFVSQHTVGFAEIKAVAREYPPECVTDICGIAREDLERAAEWIGAAAQGVTAPIEPETAHLLRGPVATVAFGPEDGLNVAPEVNFCGCLRLEHSGCRTPNQNGYNESLHHGTSPF